MLLSPPPELDDNALDRLFFPVVGGNDNMDFIDADGSGTGIEFFKTGNSGFGTYYTKTLLTTGHQRWYV